MHVKKGDTVKILSGKDKGKTGKIVKALPKESKVVVEGINMLKKHMKSRKEGKKGEVISIAMPVHVSNVIKTDSKKETKKEVKKESKTKK